MIINYAADFDLCNVFLVNCGRLINSGGIGEAMSQLEVRRMACARIPTDQAEFQLCFYQNNQDEKEHLALGIRGSALCSETGKKRPWSAFILNALPVMCWARCAVIADRSCTGDANDCAGREMV
jgi:hypothetical protein